MRINDAGYVERIVAGRNHCRKGGKKNVKGDKWRDWWLIKYNGDRSDGRVEVRYISFPKRYVGKRIKIKIEIIEDE